ncbi:TonB-dependent receptor [bacterium]|nr:TonB-dependent receptor [bacterium]
MPFRNALHLHLIFLFAIIPLQQAFGQLGTISGTVFQENGEVVPFANVYLSNTNWGAASDENGQFKINNIPPGEYQIHAQFIGFSRQSKSIALSENQNLTVNFELQYSNLDLEEVVITGTMKEMSKKNSPVPVEVYTAKYFANNKNPSVFESLQNVNGVRPQLNCSVCNTGDIHINGLEGPYTMVLIDGMPIVSGLSTVYGLTGIPASLIEQVEIVKGPASTLYGSEAVGGLINVITKKPSTAPLFSADVFTTSWLETNADIGAKFHLGKKASSLLGVNYFKYSNPLDLNNDGFTDITLQDRISLFNKISFDRKDNRIFNIGMRYVYEDRWGGEMNWRPAFRGGDSIYGESIYTNRWEVFGNYQLPIVDENFNLQFSTNGHHQNSVYGTDRYIADQRIAFSQLTWNKKWTPSNDVLLGVAYRYTYYDDNTVATYAADSSKNSPSNIHLPGLFIQNQVTINEFNTLLLGLRYDHNNIHGNIFSPRINYKWNSKKEKTIIRLSAGNGFRVANIFTEDHAALTGAREVVFTEKLQPEQSVNVNLNVVQKFYTKNQTYVNLDGSIFYTFFSNRIVPDYETNPNQIIYANLDGQAISKGVSLNADIVWHSGVKIMGGATLMDVTIEENNGKQRQLLTENFTGVWSIEYTILPYNLTINYTGNVYSPMRLPLLGDLDNRSEYSPWFSIQNIQLTKPIKDQWSVYGGVKNLLNFTPARNSIARSFDPFDKNVQFDANGNAVPTPENPNALTFDPSYVYAANQGIRGFIGIKYMLK